MFPENISHFEQLMLSRFAQSEMTDKLHSYTLPYRELMAYYRCAIMEVETKFRVLSEEFSLEYDHNPIETIKSRLKSPESIMNKMTTRGYPLSVASIEQNLHDVAGIRVICDFTSSIYMLRDAFLKQDDITLVEEKDYIKNPKDNGYRSLHLIVEVPIFLHDSKRKMKVEVQLRTIAMDWWASSEHKIRYKKELPKAGEIDEMLKECASISADLDDRMENIRQLAEQYAQSPEEEEPARD